MKGTQEQVQNVTEPVAAVMRYSRANPPTSEQEALEAIDRLSSDVSRIETSLDHADPDTYPSDDAYRKWRNSAMGALGRIKGEVAFLERWTRENKTVKEKAGKADAVNALQATARRIKARARELAGEIGAAYSVVYTSRSLPVDVPKAHARMEEIAKVRLRLQDAFTEVTSEWTNHPLRRKDMAGMKVPLQQLLVKLDAETAVVKKYISTQTPQNPRWGWKVVCAKALARAVENGFVLTPEEQTALDGLLAQSDVNQ